jgi:hypothetical protein
VAVQLQNNLAAALFVINRYKVVLQMVPSATALWTSARLAPSSAATNLVDLKERKVLYSTRRPHSPVTLSAEIHLIGKSIVAQLAAKSKQDSILVSRNAQF